MNKKKIVIFGGQGFIGLNITKYFLKNSKFKLILIGNKSKIKNKIFSTKDKKKIIFCENDIYDLKKLYKVNLNNSIVIFAAFKIDESKSKFLNKLKNLFIYLKKSKIKSFFLLSSVSVYGNYPKKLSEITKTNPLNNYAKNCLLAEKLSLEIFGQTKINLIILRIAQVFGKFKLKYGLIEKMIKYYLKNSKFIFNEINLKRSYISVFKLAEIIDRLRNKKINNEILNISNPFYIFSFNELVNKFNTIFGFKKKINFEKQKYIIKNSMCYSSKLQKKYNIRFKNCFNSEVKYVIEYFRKYEWS
jgi:nucleoside-diphosphate-sugar epimerase